MKAILIVLLIFAPFGVAYAGHVTSAGYHCHYQRIGDSTGCV